MSSINILTDEKILSVIRNVNLYSEFPVLQAINKTIYEAPKKTGCSKCQRNKMLKASSSVTNAVKAFKDYIKRMDTDTRTKFKAAINCTDLRFTATGTDGRMREYRY